MWLLDANMDVHLVAVLADQYYVDLVAAAAAGAFDCLLTRDPLLGESAANALGSFPQFAVG